MARLLSIYRLRIIFAIYLLMKIMKMIGIAIQISLISPNKALDYNYIVSHQSRKQKQCLDISIPMRYLGSHRGRAGSWGLDFLSVTP